MYWKVFLTNNLGSRERKPKGPVVQMVKQRSAKPFSVVQIYLGPFSVVQIYLGVEPFGLPSAGGGGGPLGVPPPGPEGSATPRPDLYEKPLFLLRLLSNTVQVR